MGESFSQLFQQDQNTEYRLGHIISGTVVKIKKDSVVVNVGLKSDGEIPIEQFKKKDGQLEAKEGDVVEVTLEAIEDGYGETRVSREKAKRTRTWNYLQQAAASDAVVQGMIASKIKGGFIVDFDGVSAFLPGSLVDVRPVRDTSYLNNRLLDFKVIKIDVVRNNAVVSRRAVVEADYKNERKDLFKNIAQGSTITGIVKNLTDYGAFLDLGGLDGLLHITDMSWSRIRHPSQLLSVGQEIKVKVLEYDKEKMRISLGLKQMESSPWDNIHERYQVGNKLIGKITNITDYGCFVEIVPGIEGLVHVSEMDWSNKNIHPSKLVSPNQDVDVIILEIDTDRHRLSLGIKQTKPNPWKLFAERHKKGEVLTGIIKLITDFGIFIHFKEFNIDGLVHISDIVWNNEPVTNKTIRNYRKGREQEVLILSIDADRERISLGIKQLIKMKKKKEQKEKRSKKEEGKKQAIESLKKEQKEKRSKKEGGKKQAAASPQPAAVVAKSQTAESPQQTPAAAEPLKADQKAQGDNKEEDNKEQAAASPQPAAVVAKSQTAESPQQTPAAAEPLKADHQDQPGEEDDNKEQAAASPQQTPAAAEPLKTDHQDQPGEEDDNKEQAAASLQPAAVVAKSQTAEPLKADHQDQPDKEEDNQEQASASPQPAAVVAKSQTAESPQQTPAAAEPPKADQESQSDNKEDDNQKQASASPPQTPAVAESQAFSPQQQKTSQAMPKDESN